MKFKGVTSRELAEHLFMSRQALERYINGVSTPKVDLAFKIADYLDEDCRALFKERKHE